MTDIMDQISKVGPKEVQLRPDRPDRTKFAQGSTSSIYVMLVRRNHPPGWGNVDDGSAQGYSILFVHCVDEAQVDLVKSHAVNNPITGVFGSTWWDVWYGGHFDVVAVIHGSVDPPNQWQSISGSIGDNEHVAIVEASSLLPN